MAHSLRNTYIQTDSTFSSLPLGSDISPLYLLFSNSLRQVVRLQPSTGSVNLIINGLPPFNSPALFLHHSLARRSSSIAQLATLSRVLLVAFTGDFKNIELERKQSGDSTHRRKMTVQSHSLSLIWPQSQGKFGAAPPPLLSISNP